MTKELPLLGSPFEMLRNVPAEPGTPERREGAGDGGRGPGGRRGSGGKGRRYEPVGEVLTTTITSATIT